jgi:ATP synthase protein I
MSDRDEPSPLKDLDDRLSRLRRHEGRERSKSRGMADARSGLGFAMRIGVELVAALAVGTGIGVLLDRWLGTAPWLMLVFFVLGSAAGVLNVYRVMSGLGGAVGLGHATRRKAGRKNGDSDAERR